VNVSKGQQMGIFAGEGPRKRSGLIAFKNNSRKLLTSLVASETFTPHTVQQKTK